MAIVILSQTICPICNTVLNDGDDIIGFSAFVPNTKDPLFFFNDSAFHKACLARHPLGAKATSLANKASSRNRTCLVSGTTITEPEHYFSTGLLSSDENSSLYPFNFITIDKRNIKLWNEREKLRQALIEMRSSGNWSEYDGTKYLDNMINDLKA